MHELGLCSDIVAAIEQHAGAREVAHVKVVVGRLHHVHPDAFEQSFAAAAHGTVAEGAAAELVLVPIDGACNTCGHRWQSDDLPVVCPACESFDVDAHGGDELVLESIEFRS